MKTMLHFKHSLVCFLLVFAITTNAATDYDGSKTVTKTAKVPAKISIQISNHTGDLKVSSSSESVVTLKTTIKIGGNSKQDVDKVIAEIDNFRFNLSGDVLDIDTRFYKNMNTINGKSTITLLNGEKVKIEDLRINHELSIPKSANLALNNKYSDIEMASLDGEMKFVIYSSKLLAASFAGNVALESKYSKIKIENIGGSSILNFYDTDIEMGTCKDLEIQSKYSKYDLQKAGVVKIEAYDDKINIAELTSLSLNSKYSDFTTTSAVKDLKLDLYDSNIKVKSVENVSFNGKYCDLYLGDISVGLKTNESYDNNIYMGKVKNIEIGTSKYSLYEIGSVSNAAMNDIYDDNIKIAHLNPDFSGISFIGKYGKIEINAGSVPIRVDFNMKYPKVNIPENLKITKQIKDDSNMELVAGDSGGIIKARGYDMKVLITN